MLLNERKKRPGQAPKRASVGLYKKITFTRDNKRSRRGGDETVPYLPFGSVQGSNTFTSALVRFAPVHAESRSARRGPLGRAERSRGMTPATRPRLVGQS